MQKVHCISQYFFSINTTGIVPNSEMLPLVAQYQFNRSWNSCKFNEFNAPLFDVHAMALCGYSTATCQSC